MKFDPAADITAEEFEKFAQDYLLVMKDVNWYELDPYYRLLVDYWYRDKQVNLDQLYDVFVSYFSSSQPLNGLSRVLAAFARTEVEHNESEVNIPEILAWVQFFLVESLGVKADLGIDTVTDEQWVLLAR